METVTREPRRRHADELKARVLAACAEPGASVAAVAQAHWLNANLVHKWRRGLGLPTRMAAHRVRSAATAEPQFTALALPTAAAVAAGLAAYLDLAMRPVSPARRGSLSSANAHPIISYKGRKH